MIKISAKTLEKISVFKYLECEVTYRYGKNTDNKLTNFTRTCGKIRRTLSRRRWDT